MTFEDYLATLPEERREAIAEVRAVILENLPEGYVENVTPSMVTYDVPLERYPDTYNKKPLQYAALASQKYYMSLYLMGIYAVKERGIAFEEEYRATGKRYDVGKSCVRFRTLDDLPLALIGRTIAALDVDEYVAVAEAARRNRNRRPSSRTRAAGHG
jgi:hypothetical protein